MSNEVNKLQDGQEVLGTIGIDADNISWDSLHAMHKDTAKEVIDLQLMVGNMATANQTMIDADPKVYGIVKGLMETINDTAKEINSIYLYWTKGSTGLTGTIEKDDEENIMLYIEAANKYVASGEKLAMLASTAVSDILTTLNINPADLIAEINQEEGIKDESGK